MPLTGENQGVAQLKDRDDQQALLDFIESYLRESVAPLASEMDSEPEVLRDALRGMGDRSLLALRVPKVWGGKEVSEQTYRRFQQLVPRYSGALAFLQTQHQSAAEMLTKSENESLKQHYLPYDAFLLKQSTAKIFAGSWRYAKSVEKRCRKLSGTQRAIASPLS